MAKKEQNEVSQGALSGSDLRQREEEVLKDAAARTGFMPAELMGRSAWWGSSEIGAFHYAGTFEGKKAVLKIQGVKPNISEAYMIESFAKANKSKILRPPHLYASLSWDDDKRYEALILEFVEGQKIIPVPATIPTVRKFFKMYRDYRDNCLGSPWVDKPMASINEVVSDRFKRWRETSFKLYPVHPLRKEEDIELVDQAVAKLVDGYAGVEPEFMHGHFSNTDLYQAKDQVVLLSNLYWSWRPPLFDAVFGYHWFMYQLNAIEGITPPEVDEQRGIWLDEINALPGAQGDKKRLLNLALLERAAAGLNLDGLSSDPKKPISEYLMEATRKQIRDLLEELG